MVWVFNKALILCRKVAHNGLVALLKDALNIFRTLTGRFDRSMNDETKPVPSDEVDAFLTGKDVETAVNRYGNDGQLQLVSQSESTSAELSHMPCKGSCTLGEDH